MKKLILFFLLAFSLISFAQDEKYENIFFHNDTMAKYSKIAYSNTIKEFIKSEFVIKSKSNDTLQKQHNQEVRICLIVDKEGSVKIYENDSKNKLIDDLVINSVFKLPKVKPFVDDKGVHNWYAMTMVFKLDSNFTKPEIKSPEEEEKKIEFLNKIPTFKSCNSNLSVEESKECFIKKTNDHIRKYFEYPVYAQENNIQGRTTAYFIIEKDGGIQEKTVIDGHPVLQKSTLEIIELLPKFTPGELDGKKVRVSYAQPIIYRLQ
jgi:hypothetical protein